MRTLLLSLTMILSLSVLSAESVTNGITPEKKYVKANRTRVLPYNRPVPNKIKMDNYNTKRNVIYYTGRKGPQDPHQYFFHKP